VRINDRGPFHSNRIIDLSYAAAVRIGIAQAGSGLVEVERIYEATPTAATVDRTPAAPPVLVETAVVTQEPGGLWLQLGVFSSRDSADAFRDKMTRDLAWNNEPLQVYSRDGMHRVAAVDLFDARMDRSDLQRRSAGEESGQVYRRQQRMPARDPEGEGGEAKSGKPEGRPAGLAAQPSWRCFRALQHIQSSDFGRMGGEARTLGSRGLGR